MIIFNIIMMVIVLVAFLLMVMVLVQQPKGGGLSSAFGGNAQVVGGVQNTINFLDKSTWTLGAILIALMLLANIVIRQSGTTVEGDSILLDKNTPSAPVAPKLPTTPNPQGK